jgi:hypothetical protein
VTTTSTARRTQMTTRTRRVIGAVNVVEGALALIALVAAYGVAENLVVDQEETPSPALATDTVHWIGPDFVLTLGMSLILVGAAAGVAGSVIQQSLVFAHRAGVETLQRGFVWWYVLRPVWSALLGAIVVIAANTGLVSIGDQTTSSAGVTVLVTMGCFAGLFTDQVMQRLQGVLGAGDYRSVVENDLPEPDPAT